MKHSTSSIIPNITIQKNLLNDSNPYLILGLDLSLTSSGYCLLNLVSEDSHQRHPIIELIEVGHIPTTSTQSLGERLFIIEQCLMDILTRYPQIQVIAKEKGFTRFNNVTSLLNQVQGVCTLTLHKKDKQINKEFAPKSVKKIIAGSGNCSKTEVREEIMEIMKIKEELSNDDESDAIAVALTYLVKEELIPPFH